MDTNAVSNDETAAITNTSLHWSVINSDIAINDKTTVVENCIMKCLAIKKFEEWSPFASSYILDAIGIV